MPKIEPGRQMYDPATGTPLVEPFVMVLHARVTIGHEEAFDPPMMLEGYSPEAHEGRGHATYGRNPATAMKFATFLDAMELWQSVPRNRPVRPDGRPNRPLTSFTVEIVPLVAACEMCGVRPPSPTGGVPG